MRDTLFPDNLMNRPYAPHVDLQAAARQAMLENGFQPDFSPEVQQQLAALKAGPPAVAAGDGIRDMTGLLWSSIDNDTSKDLAQIQYAERLPNPHPHAPPATPHVNIFFPPNPPTAVPTPPHA